MQSNWHKPSTNTMQISKSWQKMRQKEARLALVYAVTVLLKEDLRLLGLHAPDKM
jgi:arginyl-tRNA synthetase